MMQNEAILHQFTTQGYVMIEGLLDPEEDLQPVIDDYTILLDEVAERWQAEGKISSPHRGLSFSDRMIKLINDFGGNWSPHFDISLPNGKVREDSPIHLSEALFNLLRNPRLLDVVELLIGPEIYSNPIQHVRIKPPERMLAQDKRQTEKVAHPENGPHPLTPSPNFGRGDLFPILPLSQSWERGLGGEGWSLPFACCVTFSVWQINKSMA